MILYRELCFESATGIVSAHVGCLEQVDQIEFRITSLSFFFLRLIDASVIPNALFKMFINQRVVSAQIDPLISPRCDFVGKTAHRNIGSIMGVSQPKIKNFENFKTTRKGRSHVLMRS